LVWALCRRLSHREAQWMIALARGLIAGFFFFSERRQREQGATPEL